MLTGRKKSLFRVIIFVFAAVFFNISIDSNHHSNQTNINGDSNEIESLVELVLEVGFDICHAIPETDSQGGENSITKINLFDWYYGNNSKSITLPIPAAPSEIFIIYQDKNIRDCIKEIIPPPPKA